ncbi:hypothetical protein ACWGDX_16530 [Streptomyces sp. NPDC055025]
MNRAAYGRGQRRMCAADESAQSPVGAIGRVTVPIPADGPGEVLVSVRGGSEAYAAWADHPIGINLRVIVVECVSARSVIVEPFPA